MPNWQGWRISWKIIMTGLGSVPVTVSFYPVHSAHSQQQTSKQVENVMEIAKAFNSMFYKLLRSLFFVTKFAHDSKWFQQVWKYKLWFKITKLSGADWSRKGAGGWGLGCTGWAESLGTLLSLQFNHCIPREVLTVVLWKLLKLLSKVKWNCSLSGQHWENKGICSWLLINVERDQHKGFIKLYITGVI